MRWRKANRNKQRALRRKTINLPPRWFMRNPDVAYETWKDWMDKLMPTMLNENSLAARMLRPRRDSLATYRSQLIPRRHFDAQREKAESRREWGSTVLKGFPYFVEPDPRTSGAYQGQSRFFMIVDDLDYPLNRRGGRMFWGDTFMVKIPDPIGVRDDSRRRT